jgi:L-asparagine oxygenase
VQLEIHNRTSIGGGLIFESLTRDGYAFLKTWNPALSSSEIAHRVGKALPLGRTEAVHEVVPKEVTSKNTYSGIFGLNRFPFHTDMAHWPAPPRYIMLRCFRGYDAVVTTLTDSLDIVRSDADILGRALVKPRRPLNGTIPLFPLYFPSRSGRASIFRWDEQFIVPASVAGQRGMVMVASKLASATAISVSLADRGDTLFIDNWRMLHARSAVAAGQTDRVIERAYYGEIH